MSSYSYIGKGKVYGGKRGAFAKKFLGNVSALSLAVSENEIELLDFTQAGGGKDDSIRRIEDVTVSMSLRNISPENLATALLGTSAGVTAGAVVDEGKIAYLGGLVRLNNTPDPAVPLVVTNSAGAVTYVEGTDYTRTKSGFEVLSTGTITEAQSLKVDYTKLAGDLVQLLTQSAADFSLTFEGLNEAKDNGRPVIVDLFKVKFGAAQNFELIGDEFATLDLTGELLVDDSIVGAGLSRYAKIEMAKPSA